MRIGIIAGNRNLPILLAKRIKETHSNALLDIVCFKGETDKEIKRYSDNCHWLSVGKLKSLRDTLMRSKCKKWIMVGQINPLRIFNKHLWDSELHQLLEAIGDVRAHSILGSIIEYLEEGGVKFLDSTHFLKNDLAKKGIMNKVDCDDALKKDIAFGLAIISQFVELDVGQTIVVKAKSVVALESLEGTDRTIRRGANLAGRGNRFSDPCLRSNNCSIANVNMPNHTNLTSNDNPVAKSGTA